MKQKILNTAKIVLKKYRPLDNKLRRFAPYRSISETFFVQYKNIELASVPNANTYINGYYDSKIVHNTFLFESFWGQRITCNPKAIFDELAKEDTNKKLNFIWVANDESIIPQYIKDMRNVRIVKFNSEDYASALNTAQTLINNMPFPPYFIRKENQRLVSPYHGIPLKYMGRDIDDTLISIANTQRNFLQSTTLLSAGEYHTEKLYGPYGVIPLIGDRIVETGMPRIDNTITPSKEGVREKLGIPPNKRLVLYAPTWKGRRGALEAGAAEQAQICNILNERLPSDCHLLVSIHQLVRSKLPHGHKIPMLPAEFDTNEVLSATDILITDYSSIMFDYLPINRALILHVPDKNNYIADRGLYFSLDEVPAQQTETLHQLMEAIDIAKKPSDFGDLYKSSLQKFLPFEDGNSSKRSLDAILGRNLTSEKPITRKRKLLFSVGALLNNGITTSLLNLISAIDYDNFDVFLVIDANTTDKDPIKLERYFRLDKRCNVIYRCGNLTPTRDERSAYIAVQSTEKEPTSEEVFLARRLFEREARRIFGDVEFDIAIDFGGYTPFWTLLISGVKAKRKVIYQHNNLWAEAYNTDPQRNQTQLRSVFRMYKWFDAIIAVSDETHQVNQDNLSDYYSCNSTVTFVRNAINPNYVHLRAQAPVASTAPLYAAAANDKSLIKFITAGRLSPEKNQARLIKAFAITLNSVPNALLFIAGHGPLRKHLTALSKKLGVSDRVIFTGLLDNPYPLIKASDCLVMSSDYEGQPMVLLEALTIGTPCIGTNVPGIRSVLRDGMGVLTEPTPEALAEAMIEFSNQAPKNTSFSPDQYLADVMNEFYNKACGEP
ncbi:glycosyltransferase [Paraburkholderia aspalathi]|nr:glycosyltransferase [Paraburkholderia aspalathi]